MWDECSVVSNGSGCRHITMENREVARWLTFYSTPSPQTHTRNPPIENLVSEPPTSHLPASASLPPNHHILAEEGILRL